MSGDLRDDTMAPGWWRRGQDDLRAAEVLLSDERGAPWVAAFHAQQAAEKAIKAYLVAHGTSAADRRFRTHEIDDLRLLVREYDDALSKELEPADRLSEYAVESRYPPVAPGVSDVTRGDARQAVRAAREVSALVREKIAEILP